MVYGGKPSTGCYLCRRRKIKCDEGQPGCRNCVVYGRPCPGYRQDTIFRNETHKVERLVKKHSSGSGNGSQSAGPDEQGQPMTAGPVVSTTTAAAAAAAAAAAGMNSDASLSPSSPSSSSGGIIRPTTPAAVAATTLSLHPIADTTWEDRAICYFFDQYTTFDGSAIGVSHLGFLPSLYALCQKQGDQADTASFCLRHAVDATALMALGNEAKLPTLIIKARNNYGQALHELRSALDSHSQAVKDETLATLAVLSMFEDIAGERNGLSSSHTVGFAMLMKLRGVGQLGHQQGRDLFNFAYTHTHVELLSLRDRPRFDTDWIVDRLDPTDPVHRLISSASKVSQVFIEASSFQTCPDTVTADKLNSWIDMGKELDTELMEWTQTLPTDWLPLTVHPPPTNEPLITYQALALSVVWSYYRAVRIVLQKLMLELRQIRTLFFGPAPDDMQVLEVIQEMITEVCRSMPYCLGDIDMFGNRLSSSAENTDRPRVRSFHGYSLLWPLWYVLSCGLATSEQEAFIRNVLFRVGSALGIKLALRLAEYNYSMPGAIERIVSGMDV